MALIKYANVQQMEKDKIHGMENWWEEISQFNSNYVDDTEKNRSRTTEFLLKDRLIKPRS